MHVASIEAALERRYAGFAYSGAHNQSFFVTNLPVERMSAYSDAPFHLSEWLSAAGVEQEPHQAFPRTLYRDYIKSLHDKARRGATAPIPKQAAFTLLPGATWADHKRASE